MAAEIQESTLFYTKEGSGEKNLLLFHGFGQDHTAFDSIKSVLITEYTLYSFDLYFHGKSVWQKGDSPISKEEWKDTLYDFLQANRIEDFSMVSFSIGARFLMSTLEAFPEQTKELFLIAPDGIKPSFWYTLATRTSLFRKIFKKLVKDPEWFFTLLEWMQHLRILPKDVILFTKSQMRTVEKRSQVYHSWVVFRNLQVPVQKAAHLINQFSIPINLLIGKYDRIINKKKVAPLLQYLEQYSLDIEEAGHHQLLKKEILQKLLLKRHNDIPG